MAEVGDYRAPTGEMMSWGQKDEGAEAGTEVKENNAGDDAVGDNNEFGDSETDLDQAAQPLVVGDASVTVLVNPLEASLPLLLGLDGRWIRSG